MQQALRKDAGKFAAQPVGGLEIRIGVNTGEVVVRHIETSGHRDLSGISRDLKGPAVRIPCSSNEIVPGTWRNSSRLAMRGAIL
jgi:hypothetical protein